MWLFFVSLLLLLLPQPAIAGPFDESLSCMEQCMIRHESWKHPLCAKISEDYIKGPQCYAIYSQCLADCNDPYDALPETYIRSEKQTENEWHHTTTCSMDVVKIPIRPLSGSLRIPSDWGGFCACLDGH